MLSAEAGSSLLFSAIAPSPVSSTNSGLLIAADIASGLAAPLHAPFSSIEDRANGWNLPPNAGFSGLAFGPDAQQLFGAASSGPQSASNLLTMDPYTGVQKVAPVPIRAAAQALHISDLAAVPGGTYQLYGLGRPVATPSASFQLYVIDPGSGQAIAIADQPDWLASLSSADALAFGPDGTLYVGGQEKVGNAAVLYVQQPNGDDPLVTRHTLTNSILGMDARVIGSQSQGAQVEVLTVVAGGQLRWLDPVSGQFTSTVALSDPVRGIAGDIAFHPATDSLTLQQVHHADFETGADGYTADNAIQVMPGMWHHSPGRWDDKLINHTYGQRRMPGFSWYYGQFETSLGGGTYLTDYHHAGILTSPLISVPECATTTLSFSYLLDVRQPLDADFVEVWAQFTDEAGQVQRTRLMSRAEGTLPQTGNRWLTATADLSPFAGREVQIQFLFDTGNVPDIDPEGWYVDDVLVASMPKAICGYKWADRNADGSWDADEPGLNEWTVYIDLDGNGRFDPALPERTFAGGVDASALASGQQVVHPEGQVALEISATGAPIWALPDPTQPSRNVLARGTDPGEEVWTVGPMLRANFPVPVHTATLDVARADAVGPTRVVLQAFDAHGNRIAEQVRTLTDNQWQTLTISTKGGQIAYLKASLDSGSAYFNHLRYLGTAPAVEGDPAFDTRSHGGRDGAFWFAGIAPGDYLLREVIPDRWEQTYPGGPTFEHPIQVVPGQQTVGRWQETTSPNLGNARPPMIAIEKYVSDDGETWYDANHGTEPHVYRGTDPQFKFVVTNTGLVDLVDVILADSSVPEFVPPPPTVLVVGESFTTFATGTWQPGLQENFATVTGSHGSRTAQASNHVFYFGADPSAELIKLGSFADENGNARPDAGEQIDYTFTVTNSGNVPLSHVSLIDPLLSGIDFVDGDTNDNGLLDAGEVWRYTAIYRITQEDIDAGMVENSATVTAEAPNGSGVRADDVHTVILPWRPDIELEKRGTFVDENGDGFASPGETIAYTFTVTNPGNLTLTNVRLSDPDVPSILCPSDLPIAALAPNAQFICTGTYSITEADIAARQKNNTATVESDQTSPITASVTVLLPVRPMQPPTQFVQFITPISVYREEGLFEPQPIDPDLPVSIEGYVWHDLNQNGIWEDGERGRAGWWVFLDLNGNGVWDAFDPSDPDAPPEPFAVTDADGRFVFQVLESGRYHVRIDRGNLDLSDGAFEILRFPGSDGHVIDFDGESVVGAGGPTAVPTVPNFGVFVYSPLVRPADDLFGHFTVASAAGQSTLLTALEPWQSFTVTNTTGSVFQITSIDKHIDTSRIAVADQFVRVFVRDGETLAPVPLPIEVPDGATVSFFAFYDPAIREGDRVIEQYPDWSVANQRTHPSHTFARSDHLRVVTDNGMPFRIDLVGGSTYDSDIVFDGAVDFLDARRLNEALLNVQWPISAGESPLFDPLSDINARCPNGAEAVLDTCAWAIVDVPRREIGLGDFGPLNVEWNRARAPLLDLDSDNSSGARGFDFVVEFRGELVPIADSDARFANRSERDLKNLVAEISGMPHGDRLLVDDAILAELGITAGATNGTAQLVLTGKASVESYTVALRAVRFDTDSREPRTVDVRIRATGSDEGSEGNKFTELEGNTSIARIIVSSHEPSESTGLASLEEVFAEEPEPLRDDDDDQVVLLDAVRLIIDDQEALTASTAPPPPLGSSPVLLDSGDGADVPAFDLPTFTRTLAKEPPADDEVRAVSMPVELQSVEASGDREVPGAGSAEALTLNLADPITYAIQQGSESASADDRLELVVPAEPQPAVPYAVVDKPSHQASEKPTVADDEDLAEWDATVIDVEGLLVDLLEDLASVRQ